MQNNKQNNKQNPDLYDVSEYSDAELFEMLDLNNPSDRELEAKIIMTINKYAGINEPNSQKLEAFFEEVYKHFFDEENSDNDSNQSNNDQDDDEVVEGMTGQDTITQSLASGTEPSTLTKAENKSLAKNNQVSKQNTILQNTSRPAHTTNFQYGPSALNPLLKETQKRVMHLDSTFRDIPIYPSSTNYSINLSDPLLNIVSIKLHSVNIPYTWYNVSNTYNANYFYLLGTTPGILDVYNFIFTVPVGNYSTTEVIAAIQASITTVIASYPEVNFGTTSITYSSNTLKPTFIFDIQQVYTECNYSMIFPNSSINPFNPIIQSQNIPSFLGFLEGPYTISAIYSNFAYSNAATSTNPPYYNFNSSDNFTIVINDPSNSIQGNNYFTIYNYVNSGSNTDFNLSTSTILDTITISFMDISGTYTRQQILTSINTELTSNQYLNASSLLQELLISYYDAASSNYINMHQYQLLIELNRATTHKVANMKQAIVFPDESTFITPISPKLWIGAGSCFLFDVSVEMWQLNNIVSQTSPSTENIIINSYNNTFSINPLPTANGLYINSTSSNASVNNINIIIPNGSYDVIGLYDAINIEFMNNPLTFGSIIESYLDASNILHSVFRMNINKIYTAQDYTLQFYNSNNPPMFKPYTVDINGSNTIKPVMWDTTLGWQIGFHSYQAYDLAPTIANNPNPNLAAYQTQNAYTYNPITNIVTLTADSVLNLNIFSNLYIILNDYTQNHLDDGLVTAATVNTQFAPSSYANPNQYRVPANYNNQTDQITSFYDSNNPNNAVTAAQLYSANAILNHTKPKTPIYSTPPFLKDMFAFIPLKLTGLSPGQTYMESGGMLQDNDRKYFGPVNIHKLNIQLMNDHGEVINLNGANWSFSMVCEYLYSITRE